MTRYMLTELALVATMQAAGYHAQAQLLESRATMACATGREWLGELGVAVRQIRQIRQMGRLPRETEDGLKRIAKTAGSRAPSG